MQKGDLVKLNAEKCFTRKYGGALKYPLSNYYYDSQGMVDSFRPVTEAEVEARRDSTDTTHPAAAVVSVPLYRNHVYQVIRARCQADLGLGAAVPGMTEIYCPNANTTTYIRRELLIVI